MLNAEDLYTYGKFPIGTLSFTFRVASSREMKDLGNAFARAVLPYLDDPLPSCSRYLRPSQGPLRRLLTQGLACNEGSVIRIGLSGEENAGKTTFVQGMAKAIPGKTTVERARDFVGDRAQSVWHSRYLGWVRHYDCMIRDDLITYELPSYRDNNKWGAPRTDIVEHPHQDKHDKKFDFILSFNAKPENREVTVYTTRDRKDDPRFAAFVKR